MSLAAAVALGAAACGTKSSDSGSGTSTGGSVPTGNTSVDNAKLNGTLNGSGATFPKTFYEAAIEEFGKTTPNLKVTYGGGGSGKGKKDLADQVVDWAGTDSTVKDDEKAGFKGGAFLYFPTVAAPITVSYNLSGVSKLQLSPSTLAKIFSGNVTTWDDAAVAADNPGTTLPSTRVTVVHRSDGSGTTSNFTKYLTTAGGSDWTLGSGDTVQWAASTRGENGNGGVAQAVKATDGAVGYVDFADAKATGLTFAAIKNKAGAYVEPTTDSASAALAGAKVEDNLTYNALDASGEAAYPITAGTYVLVYQKQKDAQAATNVKGWINFLLTQGQALAPDVDFAPLPSDLQAKAVAQIDKIT